MAAKTKSRGKRRDGYRRKSIEERIIELEAQIDELKARIQSRDSFSPERLRSERERLDLSGAEFAELVHVSMVTVYAWENGRSRPRARQLKRLEEAFAMSKEEAWEAIGICEVDEAGFSAEALIAERSRLGLSARKYALLMGVTMLTVYNWEKGRSFPRSKQLERWAQIKGISEREAERLLSKA